MDVDWENSLTRTIKVVGEPLGYSTGWLLILMLLRRAERIFLIFVAYYGNLNWQNKLLRCSILSGHLLMYNSRLCVMRLFGLSRTSLHYIVIISATSTSSIAHPMQLIFRYTSIYYSIILTANIKCVFRYMYLTIWLFYSCLLIFK